MIKIESNVEIRVIVDVDYTPARPAPACQDPDSPRFSDSGDDEVMEITAAWFLVGVPYGGPVRVPVPVALMDYVCGQIDDHVLEQCRDRIEKMKEEEYDG